jgi:hypothetical protein
MNRTNCGVVMMHGLHCCPTKPAFRFQCIFRSSSSRENLKPLAMERAIFRAAPTVSGGPKRYLRQSFRPTRRGAVQSVPTRLMHVTPQVAAWSHGRMQSQNQIERRVEGQFWPKPGMRTAPRLWGKTDGEFARRPGEADPKRRQCRPRRLGLEQGLGLARRPRRRVAPKAPLPDPWFVRPGLGNRGFSHGHRTPVRRMR